MDQIILNTCYATTNTLRSIANYSHIIPVVLSLILGIFVLIKAQFNLLSKTFLAFVAVVAIWLIGDVIIWTSNNYNLIYALWSFLVYTEVVFFALGLYFALVFVRKSDISIIEKTLLFLSTLPPFILTVTGQSVIGFDQSVCEAYNNTFLDTYKLFYEGIILTIILIYAISPFFQKFSWKEGTAKLVVLGSMFLFLSAFGITEYIAATTGYYELNLYSLFLLPVFLVAIIYSVFELDIFNFRILGTHYLVVGLIILMSGQLFFITDIADRFLTILTITLVGGLSVILFRNLKRESDQRVQIEKLNAELNELLKQRESLMHLINHKVKGAFTRSKYIFTGVLDGTFGDTTDEIRKVAQQGLDSDETGIKTIDLVLNASNMQKGTIKYDMKMIDFKDIVLATIADKKIAVEAKGLELKTDIKDGAYNIIGDPVWLKEVVNNLIENSIRYTAKGEIRVGLEDGNGKIKFSVKDTGMGITDEDKARLFTEGGRGKDSVKVNVDSTGYGLFSVKLILDAHNGRAWAESEGPGKGSQFFIEMPSAS